MNTSCEPVLIRKTSIERVTVVIIVENLLLPFALGCFLPKVGCFHGLLQGSCVESEEISFRFSLNDARAVIYAAADTCIPSCCVKGPVVEAVFKRAKTRVIP